MFCGLLLVRERFGEFARVPRAFQQFLAHRFRFFDGLLQIGRPMPLWLHLVINGLAHLRLFEQIDDPRVTFLRHAPQPKGFSQRFFIRGVAGVKARQKGREALRVDARIVLMAWRHSQSNSQLKKLPFLVTYGLLRYRLRPKILK